MKFIKNTKNVTYTLQEILHAYSANILTLPKKIEYWSLNQQDFVVTANN